VARKDRSKTSSGWAVEFDTNFSAEFDQLPLAVRRAMYARMILLAEFGPELGRPSVDTLKGSRYANMKELRFDAADGVWRIAFAFDPDRKAILLVGGDKSGIGESAFYKRLIATADHRYAAHLEARSIAKAADRSQRNRGKKG
jgi:hypothetical protein